MGGQSAFSTVGLFEYKIFRKNGHLERDGKKKSDVDKEGLTVSFVEWW